MNSIGITLHIFPSAKNKEINLMAVRNNLVAKSWIQSKDENTWSNINFTFHSDSPNFDLMRMLTCALTISADAGCLASDFDTVTGTIFMSGVPRFNIVYNFNPNQVGLSLQPIHPK